MVRKDAVDPGGWGAVSPARLVVPLDVHMHRICRALGLTGRRQADRCAALEVTAAFRTLVPEDPVRYDFSLSRLGIHPGLSPDRLLVPETVEVGPERKPGKKGGDPHPFKEGDPMEFQELVARNRSYRRFDQSHAVSGETLRDLVALARICPSAGNKQSLRFVGSVSAETNEKIFQTLGWAAYLPDWPGPAEGERPTAYVVVLADPSAWKWEMTDLGIVAQTLLLGAVSRGLGGCMIGNIQKKALAEIVQIPEGWEPALVVALGRPVEQVVIEEMTAADAIRYYRTEDGVHHVPKRSLRDLLLHVHG
jgi:nitroreductase